MANNLKTKIMVELQDSLVLFTSTESDVDVYDQLGIRLNDEFKHYPVRVGTILNFKEMSGYFTGAHEVVYIDTILYPKLLDEHSENAYNLLITYYVKRLA